MKMTSNQVAIGTKICGMNVPDNIISIGALRPNYLGFIFYEKSARSFTGTIPNLPKSIIKVGVFVNESIPIIEQKIGIHKLDGVQLHGSESPEYCANLRRQTHNKVKIIKAFSVDTMFNFDDVSEFELHCDFFLFDTKGRLPGGNGVLFDWTILLNYRGNTPFFLSGGIGVNDIKQIQKLIDAKLPIHAIDFNSKLEIEPGLKNVELCDKAIKAVANL